MERNKNAHDRRILFYIKLNKINDFRKFDVLVLYGKKKFMSNFGTVNVDITQRNQCF